MKDIPEDWTNHVKEGNVFFRKDFCTGKIDKKQAKSVHSYHSLEEYLSLSLSSLSSSLSSLFASLSCILVPLLLQFHSQAGSS